MLEVHVLPYTSGSLQPHCLSMSPSLNSLFHARIRLTTPGPFWLFGSRKKYISSLFRTMPLGVSAASPSAHMYPSTYSFTLSFAVLVNPNLYVRRLKM